MRVLGGVVSLPSTLLCMAVGSNHKDVVKTLLVKGADVNKKDCLERTPLYLAAIYGHENVARILLDKGAGVNEKDLLKNTPLHSAIEKGYNWASKSLIAHEMKLKGLEVEKPEYLQNPHTDLGTEMSKYWDECLKEIGRVKEKKIENITLYDTLVSKDADKLASYIRNEDVSDELEKVDYKNEFPIYGNTLEHQCKIGKQRLDALGVGEIVIKYFGDFTERKDAGQSYLKIAEYLSNEGIKSLRKAGIQTIDESNYEPGESSKKAPRSFKTNVDVEHAAKKQESASCCIVS